MRISLLTLLLAAAATAAAPVRAHAAWPPADDRCTSRPDGSVTAAAALARAWRSAGLDELRGRVVHARGSDVTANDYQSDRSYPPFFVSVVAQERWTDPAAGVDRTVGRMTYVSQGPMAPSTMLTSASATYFLRDSTLAPVPAYHGRTLAARALDAWLVLRDWRAAADPVRVVGSCVYRDFPRTVLARRTTSGEERLYLDPESGLPVALERREPHYLWGDVAVEYVYSNWMLVDGLRYAMTSFRVVDGAAEVSRTTGDIALVPPDSAPSLVIPADAPAMTGASAPYPPAAPTDTVRVGPQAFLLVNRSYTSAVVLAADTVWVLDATQGEARARQDSVWIGKLFPGRHAVAVVVSDLAWPHVAGLRYWVASGATIVSHRASEAFLRRVVDRRWTLAPDALERRRADAPFRFRAVGDSASLAAGALRLVAIDGIGSEGALMTYLPASRFLWAGDFVQTVAEPTAYASEVRAAARRAGIAPERVAAMHLGVTPWVAVGG